MNIGGLTAPATPEPLNVEVSKTLHKIIKNATKKDTDIKTCAQKALGICICFHTADFMINTVQICWKISLWRIQSTYFHLTIARINHVSCKQTKFSF